MCQDMSGRHVGHVFDMSYVVSFRASGGHVVCRHFQLRTVVAAVAVETVVAMVDAVVEVDVAKIMTKIGNVAAPSV